MLGSDQISLDSFCYFEENRNILTIYGAIYYCTYFADKGLYVCMYVCVYVCLSVCMSICLYVCLSISLYACYCVAVPIFLIKVCLYVCLVCLSVHTSFYYCTYFADTSLCVHMRGRTCVCLCVCMCGIFIH